MTLADTTSRSTAAAPPSPHNKKNCRSLATSGKENDTTGGGGSTALVHQQQQRQQQQQQLPPMLRRDEMAVLKAALTVIVVKRRMELRNPTLAGALRDAKKRKPASWRTDPYTLLQNVTGESLFHSAIIHHHANNNSSDILGDEATMSNDDDNNNNNGDRHDGSGVVRLALSHHRNEHNRHSSHQQQQHSSLSLVENWESHLQHVLQLIVVQKQVGNMSRSDALCLHVACQLEQAAVAAVSTGSDGTTMLGASGSNLATRVVMEWIRGQLTSFRIPSNAANQSESLEEMWWSVWNTIFQAKPHVMSELLVPVLLDLLLNVEGPKPSRNEGVKTVTLSSTNHSRSAVATTPTAAVKVVALKSVYIFQLLDHALDHQATPLHVIQSTWEALQHASSTTHDDDHDGSDSETHAARVYDTNNSTMAPSLRPGVNSSWYSTQDMAYDYYFYYCQPQRHPQMSRCPVAAGEAFLLGHGLASISQRLAVSCTRDHDDAPIDLLYRPE